MDKTTKEAWTGSKKKLSPEAEAKRISINKKIAKYGCLFIVAVFLILMIPILLFSGESEQSVTNVSETTQNDPLHIGIDSLDIFIDKKMDTVHLKKLFGNMESIISTSPLFSIIYLDSANVSMVKLERDNRIVFAGFGKESGTNFVNDFEKDRQEAIKAGFSPWDGSHLKLERFVKKNMNDPDSYEHVKTRYWDMQNYLVVKTVFRGKNAYGAKVMNSVKVKTDIFTGEILEVME